MTPAVALTIASSDSGGGAGIQADLATFAAHGVHGCTAIAALTAQNTREVRGVLATPPEFLRAQIEAVLDDLPVAAVKTGLLATKANVEVVSALARAGHLPNLVVDPVMVSSSGSPLLDADAERAYVDLLLPFAGVITPNCREAAVLLGWTEPITAVERQREAAHALHRLVSDGATVIVKGGDGAGAESTDVECGPGGVSEHRSARIETANDHGTGCSYAAAIVALLAQGHDIADAIGGAHAYLHRGLESAIGWHLGAGHGPIDHFPPPAPKP